MYSSTILVCLLLLINACASSGRLNIKSKVEHRYFLEVERPGSVYSILSNEGLSGEVKLVEVDDMGEIMGDTLNVWVEHFNGSGDLNQDAIKSDLIVACHRNLLPLRHQERHVLPRSEGKIYVYMIQRGFLVISNNRIRHFEVLRAQRKKGLI